MSARYYIYRNLHTASGCSVKYKGHVVDVVEHAILSGVNFVVSQAGRHRVLKEKKRNVHAFVSPETYTKLTDKQWKRLKIDTTNLREITYNPYHLDQFVFKDSKQPVAAADRVLISNGRVYLLQ